MTFSNSLHRWRLHSHSFPRTNELGLRHSKRTVEWVLTFFSDFDEICFSEALIIVHLVLNRTIKDL
jgi:hypothetical protein